MSEHAFAELGLDVDATDEEVKAAWRRLVSLWHPDRNASAQAVVKIQRINQAFDAIRLARLREGRPAGAPAPAADPSPEDSDDTPGRTIRRRLKLTLEEAAAGCIRPVRGRHTPTCAACEGRGHAALASACRRCGGKGTVLRPSVWFGWPGTQAACADCAGSGVAREACTACQGSGKGPTTTYQVRVRIPAGVRDGDLLHVAARRVRASRAPADLELQIQLAPHALFALQDDGDLRCEVPVDGFAWIAQRSVPVPTLDGPQPLALQRDRVYYTLPGQGFPRERGGARGDLQLAIVPVFPERLSTDQDILLDQLIATTGGVAAPARLRQWQQHLGQWDKRRQSPSG